MDPSGIRRRVGLIHVGGVALLPEELAGAQEEARAQLPSDHVGPLVEQEREIPIALGPLRHVFPDDGLRGRTHHHRLGELLATSMGHDGELGAEPLDVLCLSLEVRLGDEQWEVGVLRPRRLDASVDLRLDPLPDRIAVGPDDHGPSDRTVLGELRLGEDVLVPARKVLRLGGEHALLCHDGCHPLHVDLGAQRYPSTPPHLCEVVRQGALRWPDGSEQAKWWRGPRPSRRSRAGPAAQRGGDPRVGRHHPLGTQRVHLLGRRRQARCDS